MKVAEIFNDFYSLITGRKFTGLEGMLKKYRGEPMFYVMLSNLSAASELPLFDAMQEAYSLYKEFGGEKKPESEADLEKLYDKALEYGKKWDNPWCWQLIGALVAQLDPDCTETDRLGKAA